MLADTPVREGYLQATAGASTVTGPYARIEGGYRPLSPLALYAFGLWTPRESSVGAGARWRF